MFKILTKKSNTYLNHNTSQFSFIIFQIHYLFVLTPIKFYTFSFVANLRNYVIKLS